MARKHGPGHKRYEPVNEGLIRSAPFAIPGSRSNQSDEQNDEAVDATKPLPSHERAEIPQAVHEGIPRSTPIRITKALKFLLPQNERTDVLRLVNAIGEELQSSVEFSHIARAFVYLLKHAENEILKAARRHGPLKRPENRDVAGIAEFEQQIAGILRDAIRGTSPIR